MSTRRFDDEERPDANPFEDAAWLQSQNLDETRDLDGSAAATPAAAPQQPVPSARAQAARPAPAKGGDAASRSAHTPRTLLQVLNDADARLLQGDMQEYVPIPTGFEPLDTMIGGGIRRSELVLLGGAQGVGKTIASLQIARNIAMRPSAYAFYLSFEHTESHLLHRLLCLESVTPPDINTAQGVKLRDLQQVVVSERARGFRNDGKGADSLKAILRKHARTSLALDGLERYADRLILLKASPSVTTLRVIRELTGRLCEAVGGNVTLFVDYLQKVAVYPERPRDEGDKVTIIVEGLKDIAMTLDIPVWSIVAADREGLKARRIHLYHMRGSSALDYESDIAVVMNNKYQILTKDHVTFNPYVARQFRDWVVFTVEKNRAGRAMRDTEYQLHGQHFAFNPRGNEVQQSLIDDKIIES